MNNTYFLEKIGMSSAYIDGKLLPITILKFHTSYVVKNLALDNSSLLCFGSIKPAKVTKSMLGFFEKNSVPASKYVRTISACSYVITENNSIDMSKFSNISYVNVRAKTAGKGTQGAMKRHGFGGLRASHGVSISHRSHGSTGACQDPGKVFKGKKMAGRMGNTYTTIKNIKVFKFNSDEMILAIIGSVPGKKGNLIEVSACR
jgi:large subunit ribosomal protein L3